MGWTGGTEIFDSVVEATINYIPENKQREVYKDVIGVLEGGDWDTQCESEYADHPVIGKLLGCMDDSEKLEEITEMVSDCCLDDSRECRELVESLKKELGVET